MAAPLARALVAALVVVGVAPHPCDDAHGAHCPEHGPEGLGACLAAVDAPLGAACDAWLAMNKACEAEMGAKCAGAAYGNDAELCLTAWNKPADFSEGCQAAIPAPAETVEEEEEVDEETRNRRAARKAARKKAADQVRKLTEQQKGGAADAKASGASKPSKSKRAPKKPKGKKEQEMFDAL